MLTHKYDAYIKKILIRIKLKRFLYFCFPTKIIIKNRPEYNELILMIGFTHKQKRYCVTLHTEDLTISQIVSYFFKAYKNMLQKRRGDKIVNS